MQTLRIGGVPEHFNLPVHLGIEKGHFADQDLAVSFHDFPGGTGEMTEALRSGEIDLCILLTEGIVTDILNGNPSKIVSGYVKTPLIWGIHTHTDSMIDRSTPIFNKKIAISRRGSGSHLMPIVDAMLQDLQIEETCFQTVKNIDGAIESLNSGTSEIFYWEKFTTKPYVQKGQLRKIGEFKSPWPCFVIAARNQIIENKPDALRRALKVIHQSTADFMVNEHAAALVASRYDLNLQDAERWYHSTEWATDGWVSNKMLEGVLYYLKEAGIIDSNATTSGLIWEQNKKK